MSGQKLYLRAPRLFDGADQRVRDAAVLIEGREIAAVGRAADIACPDDALSVDLRDCTLLPGLIDCHDHLGIDMGQEEAQSHESAAWHTVKAVRNGRRCLEAGITTMRDLGELRHVEIEWRRAIASGLMDGPDLMDGPELLVAGEFITRTGGHGWFFGREADGPDEVRRAVREQLRVRADVIKIMVTNGAETAGAVPCAPGYTREEIGAAVDEAHEAGLKIAAHAQGGPAVQWAVEAGVDSIEHGSFLTDDDLRLLAARGTYLVSTYGVLAAPISSGSVPPVVAARMIEVQRSSVQTLARARALGVRVATGGDSCHANPALEAEGLRAAGYPSAEVLAALTSRAAELCGLADRGVLAAGRRADVVAVSGDPLEDLSCLSRVELVVQAGRLKHRADGGGSSGQGKGIPPAR
jgi:imidazolonepropionase-like amidohydrolase